MVILANVATLVGLIRLVPLGNVMCLVCLVHVFCLATPINLVGVDVG